MGVPKGGESARISDPRRVVVVSCFLARGLLFWSLCLSVCPSTVDWTAAMTADDEARCCGLPSVPLLGRRTVFGRTFTSMEKGGVVITLGKMTTSLRLTAEIGSSSLSVV